MSGRRKGVTADGYDRVGPFHPFVAWIGVALFDVSLVLVTLTTVLAGVDWTEDWMFPGGPEYLPF